MNHVFIYAQPTSQEKNARMAEVAAVRISGFGPYKRSQVQCTFHETNANPRLLEELYDAIVTPEPFVFVTHSKEITKGLLRIEAEKLGQSDKFFSRVWLDVNDLAWPLLVSGQVKGRTIETLAKHFGVSLGDHSDSADIVEGLLQVYGLMMTRYNTALKGESMVREAGGETLAGLRNMMGF